MGRLMQKTAALATWCLALMAALTLGVQPALAIQGSTNIQVQNGVISLTGLVPLANGGTNKNLVAANGGVVWTDADSVEVTAAGTSGQILQSAGAGAPVWVDKPVALIGFGTGMAVTTSQTVYIWPGLIDGTKANVAAPVGAATFNNMRCRQGAAAGGSNDVVVTLMAGTCGSESDTGQALTITGGASPASAGPDTTAVNVSAGECVVMKFVTPAALTNPQFVSCTIERTA